MLKELTALLDSIENGAKKAKSEALSMVDGETNYQGDCSRWSTISLAEEKSSMDLVNTKGEGYGTAEEESSLPLCDSSVKGEEGDGSEGKKSPVGSWIHKIRRGGEE